MNMSRIFLSPPDVGPDERRLLLEAFDSNWIAPLGPHVDAFERELADKVGVPYAVALSSGTAALHLSLSLIGVRAGDEVLTSSLTFAATANAIRYRGASPVFIDSDAETWQMNPDLLREELAACAARDALPRAVLVVDLYGQCADYDRIANICDEYGVPIIEDAAEALGSTYKGRSAGSFGALAAFSFNGNKIITTSSGGMLVSHRSDWIDHARFLSMQARDDAAHYQHSEVGYNYRMSNLLAAVGRGQLQHIDDRVRKRRANNAFYRTALADVPGISFMPEASYGLSNNWLTAILIEPEEFGKSREELRLHLESRNIESRPVWKPMHLQPAFEPFRRRVDGTSEALFERGLCLPSGSSLTAEQRERVAEGIRECCPATRASQPRRESAPPTSPAVDIAAANALSLFAEGRFVRVKRAVIRQHRAIAIVAQLGVVAMANLLAFWLRFDGNIPSWARETMWNTLPALVAVRALTFVPFKLHQGLWRFTSVYDLKAIIKGVAASTAIFVALVLLLGIDGYPRSVYLIDSVLLVGALSALRLSRRFYEDLKSGATGRRVLIVGAGSAGEMVARDLLHNPRYGLRPVAFVDDAPDKRGRRIHGVPVAGGMPDLASIITRFSPNEVIVALPSASAAVVRAVWRDLEAYNLPIKTLPSLRDLLQGQVSASRLRAFRMEDLLQRAPARLASDAPARLLAGRRVLITGAGSGEGAELARQILTFKPDTLVLADRFEQALRTTEEALARAGGNVEAVVADVSDPKQLSEAIAQHKPEIVFHTGAHNYARTVEESTCAAVLSNVRGTRQLVEACRTHGTSRLILVSTNAVANASTPLAATRQLAERVALALTADGHPSLSIVRFGTILGRPDSAVPRLRQQILNGGPATVSHPDARRYFMLSSEAVTLALHAGAADESSAIHVLDMGEPLRLSELARNLIRIEGFVPDTEIPVRFTGLEPGETLLTALARPGEIVSAASPGLLRVKPDLEDATELLDSLKRLVASAERGDERKVVKLLEQLVPELSHHAAPGEAPFEVFSAQAAHVAPAREPVDPVAQECPSCRLRSASRSRARSASERLRKKWSNERPYRCRQCGWRGWMAVIDQPTVASPVPAEARDLDDLDITVATGARDDVSLKALD